MHGDKPPVKVLLEKSLQQGDNCANKDFIHSSAMVSQNTAAVQFECILHISECCILAVKALSSDKALLFIKMFHKSLLWEQQTSPPHQSQIPFRAQFGMLVLVNLKYRIVSLSSVVKIHLNVMSFP